MIRSFPCLALLLALSGCGQDQEQTPATPYVGTWILDPQAVYQVLLEQTKADLAAEGQQAEKLTQAQLTLVRSSAEGSTLSLVLAADATFTRTTKRNVPGISFTETATGTWSIEEAKMVLTVTGIDGEMLDAAERVTLLIRDGKLQVDYFDHPHPMIRK